VSIISYLQMISYIINILGFPLAIYVFLKEKKKERHDREYGTYNALDDKYVHYLELCLKHSDLDIFDVPLHDGVEQSPIQKRQEEILFTILISILERAFLMYKDQSTRLKKRQWTGWVAYMHDYGSRENFRRAWIKLGGQFDSDFVDFMNSHIAKPLERAA